MTQAWFQSKKILGNVGSVCGIMAVALLVCLLAGLKLD